MSSPQRDRLVSEQEIGASIRAVIEGDHDAWPAIPVPIRLLAAALALSLNSNRVSTKGLTKIARLARSGITRPTSAWKPLVDAMVAHPSSLGSFLLAGDTRRGRTVPELEEELAARDNKIRDLKERIADLEAAVGPIAEVANQALDRVAEIEGLQRARDAAKVRPLRPVP